MSVILKYNFICKAKVGLCVKFFYSKLGSVVGTEPDKNTIDYKVA